MKLVTVAELHAWGFPCRLPSDVRAFRSDLGQDIQLTHNTLDRREPSLKLSTASMFPAEMQNAIDRWYHGSIACAAKDPGDLKGKSDWLKANSSDASYQSNSQVKAIRQKVDDAMMQGIFPSLTTEERLILDRDTQDRQQHEMGKAAKAAAAGKSSRADWPKFVQAHAVPRQYPHEGLANPSSDSSVLASDQLARGVEPANDNMRVPTHEEREVERTRLAEYFRKYGVL